MIFTAGESTLGAGEGCDPACPPALTTEHLCDGHYEMWSIDANQPWTVDLSPGPYYVSFAFQFVGPGDLSGGAFAAFGLIIDGSRERAVIPADAVEFGCQSDNP